MSFHSVMQDGSPGELEEAVDAQQWARGEF